MTIEKLNINYKGQK